MINKDRISAQDIVDILAVRANISKTSAEDFFRVFINSVENALVAGDSVKIKNFGTFKRQWIAPRKSIDVNTNEEITIDGYYKINFTPFLTLKYAVNKPFAHLENVMLDGDENADAESAKVMGGDTNENLRHFKEQANEIKDILSEIKLMDSVENQNEKNKEKSNAGEEEQVQEGKDASAGTKVADVRDDKIIVPDANDEVIENENSTETKEPEAVKTDEKDPPQKKKKCVWCILLLIFLFLMTAFVLLYFFHKPVKDKTNSFLGISEGVTKIEKQLSSGIATENNGQTVPIESGDSLESDSLAVNNLETPVDTLVTSDPFQNTEIIPQITYNEFIDTVTLNTGNRLSLLARRYYDSPYFWVYIYEANKDKILDPDVVPIGTEIRIPKMDPKIVDANDSKAIEKAKERAKSYKR
jgi:nucleoid DNA-binding protein/nucleoid-associated protein YgaU